MATLWFFNVICECMCVHNVYVYACFYVLIHAGGVVPEGLVRMLTGC
jgi:hypothetical protein